MSVSVYSVPGRPDNEVERRLAVSRSGALLGRRSESLDRITEEARRTLGTAAAIVTIIDDDACYVISASGSRTCAHRRSTSFCGHAILTPNRLFIVPDAHLDDRFAGNPFVEQHAGIRFYAAAALVSARDLAIGTLCVLDDKPRAGVSDAEAVALKALADAAMRAFAQ